MSNFPTSSTTKHENPLKFPSPPKGQLRKNVDEVRIFLSLEQLRRNKELGIGGIGNPAERLEGEMNLDDEENDLWDIVKCLAL